MELVDKEAAWPVAGREDVYRGHAITVHRDRVTSPGGGAEFVRDVVDHVGAVGVLALDEQGRVLVVRQYRHPAQAEMVELPAGLRDEAGEPPIETARRELREEGHVSATGWEPLITTSPSPGTSSEIVEIFLATGITADHPGDDFEAEHEEAEMERSWVPMADLVDAVLAGRVRNALLVSAVLAYEVRRQRNAEV